MDTKNALYIMNKNTLYYFIFLAVLTIVSSCNPEIIVDRYEQEAPIILSFSPVSGDIGTEITVRGENLQLIDSARIGGVSVPVKYLVSDTIVVIVADKNAISGKIELIDGFGRSAISENSFNYLGRVPEITSIPKDIEAGSQIEIKGSNLNSVNEVLLAGDPVKILYQNYSTLVIQLPVVGGNPLHMELKYLDDDLALKEVVIPLHIKLETPIVQSVSKTDAEVGDIVYLGGEYLNLVDSVMLGEVVLPIESLSSDGQQLAFNIIDDVERFPNGQSSYNLSLYSGDNVIVLDDQFSLSVRSFYAFKNLNLSAQSRDATNHFVSLEQGLVRSADNFHEIGPMSVKYDGDVCSEQNISKLTEAEYSSVSPYIFMIRQSAATNIFSPAAGKAGYLTNYTTSAGSRIIATQPAWGTPILSFRVLDKESAFERVAFEKIKSGDLSQISTLFDDNTFISEIDLIQSGAYSADGWSNSITNFTTAYHDKASSRRRPWAEPIGSHDANITVDPNSVILIIYYNKDGFNASQPLENAIQFGFVDVFNYEQDNSADAGRKNNADINIYWKRGRL